MKKHIKYNRLQLMKLNRIFLLILLSLSGNVNAYTIQLTFDVQMNWRYDLSSGQFDPNFSSIPQSITTPFGQVTVIRPPSFVLSVFVDDYLFSRQTYGDTTNIIFGPAHINSPLINFVSMGIDTSILPLVTSYTGIQDTYISPTNQGIWTAIYEMFNSSDKSYSRLLQYTNDPRLTDPKNFGSNDLFYFLQAHIGYSFGYSEDSNFSSVGFQHNGTAILREVSHISSVPEPTELSLMLLSLSTFWFIAANKRAKTSKGVNKRL